MAQHLTCECVALLQLGAFAAAVCHDARLGFALPLAADLLTPRASGALLRLDVVLGFVAVHLGCQSGKDWHRRILSSKDWGTVC